MSIRFSLISKWVVGIVLIVLVFVYSAGSYMQHSFCTTDAEMRTNDFFARYEEPINDREETVTKFYANCAEVPMIYFLLNTFTT